MPRLPCGPISARKIYAPRWIATAADSDALDDSPRHRVEQIRLLSLPRAGTSPAPTLYGARLAKQANRSRVGAWACPRPGLVINGEHSEFAHVWYIMTGVT